MAAGINPQQLFGWRRRFRAAAEALIEAQRAPTASMFAPVVTRFVTYSIPMPPFAAAYMQAVLSHRWMQDWIASAQEEEWVIERYEQATDAS